MIITVIKKYLTKFYFWMFYLFYENILSENIQIEDFINVICDLVL